MPAWFRLYYRMTETTQHVVQLALRRSFGSDNRFGTAYSGWMVQFGAASWSATALWRVVWFMGNEAATRDVAIAWGEIEALLPALREFCAGPPRLEARFDTSDSWEHLELVIALDGQDSRRLSLHLRSSGFEGEGEEMVGGIIEAVERLAGIQGFRRPSWAG